MSHFCTAIYPIHTQSDKQHYICALNIFLSMRYINLHFTYLLTYLHGGVQQNETFHCHFYATYIITHMAGANVAHRQYLETKIITFKLFSMTTIQHNGRFEDNSFQNCLRARHVKHMSRFFKHHHVVSVKLLDKTTNLIGCHIFRFHQ